MHTWPSADNAYCINLSCFINLICLSLCVYGTTLVPPFPPLRFETTVSYVHIRFTSPISLSSGWIKPIKPLKSVFFICVTPKYAVDRTYLITHFFSLFQPDGVADLCSSLCICMMWIAYLAECKVLAACAFIDFFSVFFSLLKCHIDVHHFPWANCNMFKHSFNLNCRKNRNRIHTIHKYFVIECWTN